MPEDVALLDSPEVEIPETEPVEPEGAEPSEPAEVEPEAGKSETDSAPVIADANGQLRLSEKTKAELDRIKAENPKLAREMRAALFDRTVLAQKGLTVKQALETIEAYDAEGGSEAVQQVKEELGAWKSLDEDFQAAKPQFVDDIAAGNPEAFTKLGPVVMAKLQEIAPEVYSHEVSKVFAADMAANDVMLTMRLLQREIGLLPEESRGEVQKLWTQLAGYVDRVNTMARTAPKQEAKPNPAAAPSELDQREQALRTQEFTSDRTRVKDAITETEFTRNAAGRKLPEEKISTIRELYESALDRLVKSIPGHTAKVDRFFAANDRTGYRKHMEAAIRSKAPEAMAQAFRRAGVGNKPGPQPGKPTAKPAPAGKPVTTPGFTRVATKPEKNQINWTATAAARRTKEDADKYVLRDGSKVIWRR